MQLLKFWEKNLWQPESWNQKSGETRIEKTGPNQNNKINQSNFVLNHYKKDTYVVSGGKGTFVRTSICESSTHRGLFYVMQMGGPKDRPSYMCTEQIFERTQFAIRKYVQLITQLKNCVFARGKYVQLTNQVKTCLFARRKYLQLINQIQVSPHNENTYSSFTTAIIS